MRKLVVVLVVVAVAGGVAFWLHRSNEHAAAEQQAEQQASAAMAEVNTAESSLGDRLQKAAVDVATSGLLSMSKAGAVMTSEMLPVIDDYLAKLDRALLLSHAYVAFRPELEKDTHAALEHLTARGRQIHAFRDRVAELADHATKGTLSSDELVTQLSAAASSLIIAH